MVITPYLWLKKLSMIKFDALAAMNPPSVMEIN